MLLDVLCTNIRIRKTCVDSIRQLWRIYYKKDGYRQRNVRQFLHILASSGYAHGTIAVNVTWMERGFNAGQTHCSMYPSIFKRLRAIARYWSEIATFSYPLAFNAPVGGVPIGIPEKRLDLRKLESWGYHGSEDSLTIG